MLLLNIYYVSYSNWVCVCVYFHWFGGAFLICYIRTKDQTDSHSYFTDENPSVLGKLNCAEIQKNKPYLILHKPNTHTYTFHFQLQLQFIWTLTGRKSLWSHFQTTYINANVIFLEWILLAGPLNNTVRVCTRKSLFWLSHSLMWTERRRAHLIMKLFIMLIIKSDNYLFNYHFH